MSSHIIITNYVLENAIRETVPMRIKIYRALADTCGTPEESKELTRLADDLQAIENRAQEFHFNFKQSIRKS
jgi:hypothetical protein